jgi:hypothetical protein
LQDADIADALRPEHGRRGGRGAKEFPEFEVPVACGDAAVLDYSIIEIGVRRQVDDRPHRGRIDSFGNNHQCRSQARTVERQIAENSPKNDFEGSGIKLTGEGTADRPQTPVVVGPEHVFGKFSVRVRHVGHAPAKR